MSKPDTRISTPGDFPNLAVYERVEPTGKVFTIVFKQYEFANGIRANLIRISWLLVLIAIIYTSPIIAATLETKDVPKLFSYAVIYGVMLVWFLKIKPLRKVKRTIELDIGVDQLRVLNNGRVEIVRPISRMDNLTVDVHPDAEYRRMVRQEDSNKKLSDEEKQHCLFGWFGAGGAEQIILLSRVEWPSRNSLREVRLAILWAIQQAAGPGAPDLLKPEIDTIKPPLD